MPRKTGLEIQQRIISSLLEKECSLRELETRLNTNYGSIRAHCRMLAFYGVVELLEHKRSDANGRPYTTVRVTDRGRELAAEQKAAFRRILR